MVEQRHALSLVEVVISLLIVAIMAAAGLSAAGQGARTRLLAEDRAKGQVLASSLLAEILAQPYRETAGVLGLDSGEVALNRATFDDVDDFNSYVQSPPASADAVALASSNWRWKVEVAWVAGSSLSSSPTETGRKRVTVTVTKDGRTVAEAVGLRSLTFEEARR